MGNGYSRGGRSEGRWDIAVRCAGAKGHGNVEAWAPLLWSSDYRPFLRLELEQGSVEREALLSLYPQSSYRQQSYRRNPELTAGYDRREELRARDLVATARRARNMRDWTFSQLARSGSYFNQRVPHRVWTEESAKRRLASRPTCVRLLRAMVECEPAEDFTLNDYVAVFGADQTYKWQGCSKGKGKRHRGQQRRSKRAWDSHSNW